MITRTRTARALAGMVATAGLLVGALGGAPAAADTQMTATEGVNIRSGPSTTTTIIGGLYRGQTVTAVSSRNGWTKIRFLGHTAYIASRYLTKGAIVAAPAGIAGSSSRVTTTNLNLRRGPGLSYGIITVLAEGTTVTLTGKSARGFVEVTAGSRKGWVSTQYLASSSSGLPRVIGTRVATADLLIRTTAGSDYRVVAEVRRGTKLAVTGATQNGRAQIIYRNAIRWVTAKYLANAPVTLPAPPPLPKVVGTRYATADLLIRSTYANRFTAITEVPYGTELAVTGVVRNARAQVVYDNAVRWVTAKYLSTTRPAAGGNPTWAAVERGLKPNAIRLHRAIRVRFPQIKSIGGVRPGTIPDHPEGRALDLMIPNYKSSSGRALGSEVSTWARINARSFGIEYVIWDQRIWNIRRDREGWRFMANRGSDSANHKNHVHISIFRT